jgi:hypothetical protein
MFTEVFDILLAKILKPFEFDDEKKQRGKRGVNPGSKK